MATGWWAEIVAAFNLSVTPAVGMGAATLQSAPFGLAVVPAIGMAASGQSAADFALVISPGIGMETPQQASFGLTVAPALGMTSAERYARSFEFGVTPQINPNAAAREVSAFGVTLTPALGFTGVQGVTRLTFSDNFDRADSTTLGADWTEWNITGNSMAIASNRLQCQGSGSGGGSHARWNTLSNTDDQFSQAELGPNLTGTVRMNVRGLASDTVTMVSGLFTPNTGAWDIRTSVAGSETVRASGTAATGSAGQVVRFECSGNVYTLKVGGTTIGTWTDTGGVVTPGPTRRTVGIRIGVSGSSTCNVDNWSGGDL